MKKPASGPGSESLPFSEAVLLEMPPVARATAFAAWMHRKQFRKYGGGEYIRHPLTVATTLSALGISPEGFTAALLHDTIEDTGATPEQIERLFGAAVRGWVMELTNPEFADKAARMEFFRAHIATLSLTATQIKLSDRLSNLYDCAGADAKFITRYTAEALVIVEAVKEVYRKDPIVKTLSDRIRARVAELTARVVDG